MLKAAAKKKNIERGGTIACMLRFKRRGSRYVLWKPLAKCQSTKFFEAGGVSQLTLWDPSTCNF